MPSPFENLAGPGKPLKAEPPDAKELPGSNALAWQGCSMPPTLRWPSKADSISATTRPTGLVWPRCAGMDIDRPTATSSSSCCRTR